MSTPPPPPPGQPEESQPSPPADPPAPNAPGQPSEPTGGEATAQPPFGYGQQPTSYDPQGGPAQSGSQQSAPANHEQQGAPQYAGQQYAGQPGGTTMLSPSEEKTWTVLAHLAAPIAALVSVGLLNFVGPLVIWAIYKDRSAKVRHASAGAFNFNITLWIVYAVLVVASILSLGFLLLLTIPLGIAVWVLSMVLHIMAAVKASNGEVYTYPAQIKLLS